MEIQKNNHFLNGYTLSNRIREDLFVRNWDSDTQTVNEEISN